MIFHSPKKLLSVAKAFSPAWITNLSPARLFTTNPTPEESIILDPPTWPEDVARDEFWENGAPIAPHRRLKRCYGPNNSFHRSIHLKQLQANRAWNAYQKKRSRYEAQQAKRKRLEELNKPVPLAELHAQAMQKLYDSNDPEDRIFLRELGQLHNQTDNPALSVRKPHTTPSFSTFQRERRSRAIQEAAARKRQQAQREQPNTEDRRSKERTEKERKIEEYEEQRAREREAGRIYMAKVREQVYREEIRIALEQGRPPPDHLRHRQDLIQEIGQLVTQTALHRQQEAARRAENEREQRFARQQEARRRAEEDEARRRAHELEARRRAEQEAQRYAEERARAIAELYARRQAKLAEERAAREAEQRRREQEEAQRLRDEAAAREEEARRAQEEARRAAEEEARRHQAQQEQASHTLHSPSEQIFELYDNKWAALRGTEVYSGITFTQFPWPVLYQVSDIGGITLDSVRAFFAHRGTTGRAMKAEILKWHPDKLNNQLHQVHAEHREQVREAGELVAKFLNNIMED